MGRIIKSFRRVSPSLGFNLARSGMDVSPKPEAHSTELREVSPMSAADDVAEMESIVGFIADKLTSSKKNKPRTEAIYTAFNPDRHRGDELVSWNRCFEFLTGRARTVQSWEKDLARAKRDAIRDAERERQTQQHIEWLKFIHQQATQDGADADRADLAALERVLSRVGALDRPVGNSSTAD